MNFDEILKSSSNIFSNYFILFATILSGLAISMMTASRGNIVNVLFLVLICYLVFKTGIPTKIKKHIRLVAIIALVIISIFLFYVVKVFIKRKKTIVFYFILSTSIYASSSFTSFEKSGKIR